MTLAADPLATPSILMRIASPELAAISAAAGPPGSDSKEWGCFAFFGWRDTPSGLVLTLARLAPPQESDIEPSHDHIRVNAGYMRRTALDTERDVLAVGFIHSHPPGVAPKPSELDEDLDCYFAGYFADFAPDRPFVALIVSTMPDGLAVSGRIFRDGQWQDLERVAAERSPTTVVWPRGERPPEQPIPPERVARLTSAFGREAFQRLQGSTVAVIGAGGTGSAAIPILARAGVGRLVIVDSDHVSESNLERLHGSRPADAEGKVPKVEVARRSVGDFAPDVIVEPIMGRLPQDEVIDAVIRADLVLGCTDGHASRLAVADIASRYLVPAIDCGGLIEGQDGVVTGQLVQIVRFLADDPCPRCRGMISETRFQHDLLPVVDRLAPADQAAMAVSRGERVDPILTAAPQIDTVGYITTTSGTLAAGFAIGWLTGRFSPRFERLQLDLVEAELGAVDRPQRRRPDCSCTAARGRADQAKALAPFAAPDHWPSVRRLS